MSLINKASTKMKAIKSTILVTAQVVKVKEAVNLYKEFARFPQVSTQACSAAISCLSNNESKIINIVQTQKDLERAEKISFTKRYMVNVRANGEFKVIYRSSPQEINNEIWNKESRSGKYLAVVRKVTDKKKEEKQYLEIWEGNSKVVNFDVLAAEKHGKIYDGDGHFGCLEWSVQEDKILYVAEKKYNKAVSYFAKPNEDAKTVVGEEHVFREEWGEGFVGKHYPVLCIFTVATGEITVLDSIPEGVSPGQAKWSHNDEGLLFTGWQHEPYRLGIIYCPIRNGFIYHLNLQTGKCVELSSFEKASRQCVLSPNLAQFVYLQNEIGGPHQQCSALLKYDCNTKETTTVTDVVKYAEGESFPGLYTVNLPECCWSMDNKRVVINSIWRNKDVILAINTETKSLIRLPSADDCCMTAICTKDDIIIAECSSLNTPHYLVVGKLPVTGEESEIKWFPLEDNIKRVDNISWKIFHHQPSPDRVNPLNPKLTYDTILIHPTTTDEVLPQKLIVFPHGGPHSVFTTSFMLYPSFLCKLGFSTLMVNYRGSAGFGNDSIYSLLGNVGSQDVQDVQSAVEEVIKQEGFNKDRLFVWGGSHGGFLACHLVGQYPGFYKAVVLRNPVINIATMLGSTDIPDWNYVESGNQFNYNTIPNEKTLTDMWKCSPLQYVNQIITPVMLMVGLDDKRVPTKQSYELYKALKARNIPVRYMAYPENGHPIVKVDSEADALINIYKWFSEHLPEYVADNTPEETLSTAD